MSNEEKDAGILQAVLQGFETHKLPRLLEIEERVKQGHKLSENELFLLDEVRHNTETVHALVEKHPKYQDLYAQAVHLYHTITQQALKNEKAD